MQSDTDSKRLRRVALTAISIATLLVLATGATCGALKPVTTGPGAYQGPNQMCDLCHDGASNTNFEMQLYVFVPGKPLMDDFAAAEQLLQGADSTAMGFSSRGCLPPAPRGGVTTRSLGVDGGVGSYAGVFQDGPPPPRTITGAAGLPHDCSPGTGAPAKPLCQEPVSAGGLLQPDGVVYFEAATAGMNDYRFVPCKYAHDNLIRSYADVKKLTADQWIHFTGTHSGKPGAITWSLTRQP